MSAILFVISFLFIQFIYTKDFSLYYNDAELGTRFTTFLVGSPPKRQSFRTTLFYPYNYVISTQSTIENGFIPINKSETITIRNQTFDTQLVQNRLCINLGVDCIEDFFFHKIETVPEFRIYDTISLSKSSYHKILSKLKSNNLIEYEKFSLIPYGKQNGKIHFGDIHKSDLQNKQKYKCTSSSKRNEWGCDLNEIIFDNSQTLGEQKVYVNNITSVFEALNNKFYVPYDFFMFLSTNVFDVFVKDNKCKLINQNEEKHFECGCGDLDDFPQTKFVFDGVVFNVGVKFMFQQQMIGYRCDHLFFYNKDNEKWIIGTRFLQNYITEFDCEKGDIGFYSDNYLSTIWKYRMNYDGSKINTENICIGIASSCFIGIVLLCLFKKLFGYDIESIKDVESNTENDE
jgi:hypothetical protein